MRAYIIRRLLLMVPTLFGVTLVTFAVMQFAPGDPLKMQLGQGGSQGESGATREAFLHQRRQWKLDKPAMFNRRWFTDYASNGVEFAKLGLNSLLIVPKQERATTGDDRTGGSAKVKGDASRRSQRDNAKSAVV